MITIEVTQEDIDTGVPGDSCRCPVAKAAERVLGCKCDILPGKMYSLNESKVWMKASLPEEASWFIVSFDQGGKVNPITFQIEELQPICK